MIYWFHLSVFKGSPKWKIRQDFLWSLQVYKIMSTNLVAHKPVAGLLYFLRHIWSYLRQSDLSGAVCISYTLDRIHVIFCPIYDYNSAVFDRIILQDKLHLFNIQEDRSTRSPCRTNYKSDNSCSVGHQWLQFEWGLFMRLLLLLLVFQRIAFAIPPNNDFRYWVNVNCKYWYTSSLSDPHTLICGTGGECWWR